MSNERDLGSECRAGLVPAHELDLHSEFRDRV